MQLVSFNYFRAVAIIIVVAGHSFGVVQIKFDSILGGALNNLLTGGTSLFLFISGFMFHHVFVKRYAFKSFMTGKVKNVLTPYLVLGLLPVCLYVATKNTGYSAYFQPSGVGFISEYLIPAAKYFWTGRFLTAYWYIPFVMVTFLMAPLHMRFIALGNGAQIFIIALLSGVSIYIHRPIDNINVLHSVVYFAPIYLFGIWCSIHRQSIYETFHGKEVYLLLSAIALALYQADLGRLGNYHKLAFAYDGIDWMYPQKLLLCVFFMVWLRRFEERESGHLINALSSTSFAIFFIHPFINEVFRKLNLDFFGSGSWAVFAVFVVFSLLFCVAVAKVMKKILPDKSRYIIGY